MLQKRNLTLSDDSGFSIDLTLWGETAEEWNHDGNPVVYFKNIKISDYNGRSLTAGKQTRWEIEPNIPRAHQLHHFASTQNMEDNQVLSRAGINSGPSPYKSLKDAKQEAIGGKVIQFSTQATILMIKHHETDSIYYHACPNQGCYKKVLPDEQQNNMWYCTKCKKSSPNFLPRYVLFVKISDDTLADFATIFNDPGTVLLGKDANEIRQMRESNPKDPELEYIFDCAIQKRFNFKIKAAEEPYQDEQRVKFTVQSIEPISYLEESKSILEKIYNILNGK